MKLEDCYIKNELELYRKQLQQSMLKKENKDYQETIALINEILDESKSKTITKNLLEAELSQAAFDFSLKEENLSTKLNASKLALLAYCQWNSIAGNRDDRATVVQYLLYAKQKNEAFGVFCLATVLKQIAWYTGWHFSCLNTDVTPLLTEYHEDTSEKCTKLLIQAKLDGCILASSYLAKECYFLEFNSPIEISIEAAMLGCLRSYQPLDNAYSNFAFFNRDYYLSSEYLSFLLLSHLDHLGDKSVIDKIDQPKGNTTYHTHINLVLLLFENSYLPEKDLA